ncbi:hypothetical protein PI93_024185 [Pandoraea fibrosis]|uniref:CBU-0592-like domain-containing protein n=1 Tax=Pandoraea fibrosis TaxID=1891094 RepID=A0ABX6HWT7_9BURK|nr:hypothetical protein [Pandoraea fibrosis]QHE94560.1 hypothetical protein PJ20_024180 [Pandoraea fibrosis]QHF15398.1 hypothetical protein PI93_024185 [Pandoraea fibrosis]
MNIPDTIGIVGALTVVMAYFLNLHGTLSTAGYKYSALNLGGSLMIVYSLAYNPNPASLLIEIFWASISAYGLYKSYRNRGSR